MKIKRIIGGNIDSNGYVIYNYESGECYIIDPGYNPDKFLKLLKELDISLIGIILTHHHYDHVGGVEKIRKAKGCKVFMHRQDADVYKGEVDVLLEHGDRLILGDEEILILSTPGHTRGSICLYAEKSRIAFTGDTLFNVDLGRTDLADGSYDEMKRSIKKIIDQWSNDITIYPGHGDPATMKYVRSYNLEFIEIMKA